MLEQIISNYSWADDYSDGRIESLTIAVIEGRAADEVIRIYGGDPTQPVGDYTFSEAFDLQGEPRPSPSGYAFDSGINFHLQVRIHHHYVIAMENNGYTGNMPEIARRCSKGGGRFFAVYWSHSSNPYMNQAVDGQVTAYVELYSGDRAYSGEPVPSWITGRTIELDHLRSTALAFMEEQTGLAFDRAWLNEKLPTYQVPDPDVMLRDVKNARTP